METIRVEVREPTERGHLVYRVDPQIEPGILFICSPARRPRAYTVNINGGQVLLSITKDFIVQSVEFNIHRWVWHIVHPVSSPDADHWAAVAIPGLEQRLTQIEWPWEAVKVFTDEAYSHAHVQFGEPPSRGMWVRLSSQVQGFIADSQLKGFHIDLRIEKQPSEVHDGTLVYPHT
jgi:hypothetical protein